eukprot:gnl/MRDRNA2_/MRDRNA2_137645_c0_seq1.p1 gnl/MRDRNA2_/MRDRNA2_137645_c0~~gnl/MRDRNA2_/MRDRNA2_137645_c0_seq1.p1  ORF type:complete len:576 (-),score=83.58 gnl/MRDRNA2_/MRDRNA2_137645_c0_seq1:31-1650(-)
MTPKDGVGTPNCSEGSPTNHRVQERNGEVNATGSEASFTMKESHGDVSPNSSSHKSGLRSQSAEWSTQKKRGFSRAITKFGTGDVYRAQENGMVDEFYSELRNKQENDATNHCPRIAQIVNSHHFGILTSLVILLNVLLIGIETEMAEQTDSSKLLWQVIEVVFMIFYTIELVMRFCVRWMNSFRDSWFVFDLGIVLGSTIDLALKHASNDKNNSGGTAIIILRVVRLGKLARLVRLVRSVRELLVLVNSIASAMRTLVWTWVLMGLVIYGFAIFYTQVLQKHAELQPYFGSVIRSGFTLFAFVTLDWVNVTREVWRFEPFMVVTTIFFVTLCAFAIMNVVIAVIVESTIQQAMNQEDQKIKDIEQEMQKATADMVGVFLTADADGNGQMTKEEFSGVLQNSAVQRVLKCLDIDFHDLDYLFDTLDFDSNGYISLHEFVQGTLQIRGTARARRLFELYCAVDKLAGRFDKRMDRLEARLDDLRTSTSSAQSAQDIRTDKLMNLMERIEANQNRLMRRLAPDEEWHKDGDDITEEKPTWV